MDIRKRRRIAGRKQKATIALFIAIAFRIEWGRI
jgi:hypothetical protein